MRWTIEEHLSAYIFLCLFVCVRSHVVTEANDLLMLILEFALVRLGGCAVVFCVRE
jgi:hypothetical protein